MFVSRGGKMKIQHLYAGFLSKIKAVVVSDTSRRRVVFRGLEWALALISLVMTVVNWFTAEYLLLGFTLAFSAASLLNILLLHVSFVNDKLVYGLFAAESMGLLLFFFISGVPNGFSALWICLIPSFAMLIFGVRGGSAFSALALGMMLFLFWCPAGRALLQYAYTDEFMLRLPFLYCSVYCICLLLELVRSETQAQLEEAKWQYRHLYRHDALTGLYNRYGINEFMEAAFSERTENKVSVIMLDVDDFKAINDQYGHICGDEVLKAVASVPLGTVCTHCRCCRWGGEEFLLIMQCDHDAAAVAEDIRRRIAELRIDCNGKEVRTTVSVGVCIAPDLSSATIRDVIDLADKALYQSKLDGKNCVTVYTLEPAESRYAVAE